MISLCEKYFIQLRSDGFILLDQHKDYIQWFETMDEVEEYVTQLEEQIDDALAKRHREDKNE